MQPSPPAATNRLLVGLFFIACSLVVLPGQSAEQTSMADIFFLDLGIVIEPVTGNEQYSRLVAAPSDDIKFRINKIKSGAVYMATSKEMLGTLDRINLRIASLEKSFHSEMNRLRRENEELREILAEMNTAPVSQLPVLAEKPVVKETPPPAEPIARNLPPQQPQEAVTQKPAPVAPVVTPPVPKFDQSEYMAGVFAYQREDFNKTLEHFQQLVLDDVSPRTQANVIYWMADSQLRLTNYTEALVLLDRVIALGDSERRDDALIQKGLLYRKLGREDQALVWFEKLVSDHPASEYAKLARMELKKAEMVP
ncbi:MAG: tetratricopeptide repeat protein [Candidatus Neomarinimicrobiota bacterium]